MSYVNHMFDSAAEEREEKAEAEFKLTVENAQSDLRTVLATAEGRRVIWRYIEAGNIYDTKYEGSGSLTYFKQGERSASARILTDSLAAHPEAILSMMAKPSMKDSK
jgi:hypothetical protein